MAASKKPELTAIEIAMQAIVSKAPASDEQQLDYAAYLKRLPAGVADALLAMGQQDTEDISLPSLKYCLCDSPEGDYPSVYAYSKLTDLIKALYLRIGKETSVSVFFGLPLSVCKVNGVEGHSDFYLRLPNQTAIKLNKTGDLLVSDMADLAETDNLEELQQGWMGDDSFLESQYFQAGTQSAEQDKGQKNQEDNPDENLPS